ncbi:TPR-like protein, partial [Polychaeton citri CBS 116435]
MDKDEAEELVHKKLDELGSQADGRQLAIALDCMPLAITQAAAYIQEKEPRCSIQQYLEELEQSRVSRTSLLRNKISVLDRDPEASNSIILTWQISFEHVYSTRKSAADLLSLMSFCDRLAIPESLIRADIEGADSASTVSDFEEDIVTLRNLSFISTTTNVETWEMHRLVQDATQLWLQDQGRLVEFFEQFVHRLYVSFPIGRFENWAVCHTLFPHAKCVMDHKPTKKGALLEWATVMHNSAWYALEQGSFTDAHTIGRCSMEVTQQQLGEGDETTLRSMSIVAEAYRMKGQWKGAEELEMKVMETRRTVLGAEHPDTLTSMANLASTFWNQGRWKEAEELFVKVVETSRTVLGAEHPDTLSSMANLASTFWNQGRWKEAEELEVKVMETRRTLLGVEHPSTLSSMANLASTFWKQGRWKEAEELQVKVMETSRTALGADHPDTLTSMANLASTFWKQGRWKEAEELQ